MFKYRIGTTLRIKDGIYQGETFVVEEDTREMSTGIISIPQYYYPRHGRWYYEDEVEPVEEGAQ